MHEVNPFWSGVVPSATGTAPHARGILFEFAQPTGDQMSVLFPLVLLPVRVCVFGSDTLHPQLSIRERDHRGKGFCSCEVGCLAKCPNPTQAAQLGGGRPMEVPVALFPCLD